MPDTVNLPGIGSTKKTYVLAGAAVVVIGSAMYYRYSKQKSAQAATASAGASTGIDPATGYVYGSAEDAAALQNQGSYINPTQPYAPSGNMGGSSSTGFTTNAAWTQAVISFMTSAGVVQDNGAALSTALGIYLAGQPLTTDQQTLVQQAIAVEGYPPVNGESGYPPHLNTNNVGVTPTGGAPGVPEGFSARVTGRTSADIWWHPVANATSYVLQISGPSTPGGSLFGSWQTLTTTNGTSFSASNLMPGTSYIVQVSAVNAAGTSAPTTPWHITTNK